MVRARPKVAEYWKSSFPRRPLNLWQSSFLAVLNRKLSSSSDDDDNGGASLCVRVERDDDTASALGDASDNVADNGAGEVAVLTEEKKFSRRL